MFQTGSQINPALGRIDYSAYAQGAIAGGQAIGQGIANLGQGIASGIEQYVKKKEAKKELEIAISGFTTLADKNPRAAEQLGLTAELRKDPKAIASVVKSLGGAPAANSLLFQLAQQQEQLDLTQSAANRKINVANDAFKFMRTGQMPVGTDGVIDPRYKAEVERTAYLMSQQSALTNAEIDKAKGGKPTAITYRTESEARAAGQAANPGFSIKVEPASSGGGFTYTPILPPQSNPDPIAGAVLAQQVPIIQKSFESAESVPASIASIHQQKDLINSGQVPTGILAPIESSLNLIGALFGNKSAEADVARTAEYDKLLSKTTFNAMQASGLRATQLNTEKEWERFNRAVAAGRENPKEAALAILDLNEKAARAVLEQHNKNRKQGKFNRFLDNSLIDYSEIEMPPEYSYEKQSAPAPAGGGSGRNIAVDY